MRSHDNGANPRACLVPNPTGDLWLDRAATMAELSDKARATGDPVTAFVADMLAGRYRRLARLRRGAH